MNNTLLKSVLLLLVIVGALNWGYIAITRNCEDDLVNAILPAGTAGYVYAAVGVAGLALAACMVYAQRGALQAAAGQAKGVYTAVKQKVRKAVGRK